MQVLPLQSALPVNTPIRQPAFQQACTHCGTAEPAVPVTTTTDALFPAASLLVVLALVKQTFPWGVNQREFGVIFLDCPSIVVMQKYGHA